MPIYLNYYNGFVVKHVFIVDTAFGKNSKKGWYHFDDASASKTPKDSVVVSVILYRRSSARNCVLNIHD